MDAVIEAIQSIGFPAVVVLLEAWYIKYQQDQNHSETEKFTKALEENTLTLTELKDAINGITK